MQRAAGLRVEVPGQREIILGDPRLAENAEGVVKTRLPLRQRRARRLARQQRLERRAAGDGIAGLVLHVAERYDVAPRIVQHDRRPHEQQLRIRIEDLRHRAGLWVFVVGRGRARVQLDPIGDVAQHLAGLVDLQPNQRRGGFHGQPDARLLRHLADVHVGEHDEQRAGDAVAIQALVRLRVHGHPADVDGQRRRAKVERKAGLARRVLHQELVRRPRQRAVAGQERIAIRIAPVFADIRRQHVLVAAFMLDFEVRVRVGNRRGIGGCRGIGERVGGHIRGGDRVVGRLGRRR